MNCSDEVVAANAMFLLACEFSFISRGFREISFIFLVLLIVVFLFWYLVLLFDCVIIIRYYAGINSLDKVSVSGALYSLFCTGNRVNIFKRKHFYSLNVNSVVIF